MALTVLVGFGPSYYLKPFGQTPMVTLSGGPITVLVHLHGALFTAWVLLFIAQTALGAQYKVAVHRRLGIAGGILAALMVLVGTLTALKTAARGGAPPGVDPLTFLVIPLSDMLLFGSFVAAALWRRADRDVHKRLMLLAYVSIIVAAVARFPGVVSVGPPGVLRARFSVHIRRCRLRPGVAPARASGIRLGRDGAGALGAAATGDFWHRCLARTRAVGGWPGVKNRATATRESA